MSNVYDVFFIVQFFALIGIMLYKLYIMFTGYENLNMGVSWLLLILSGFMFGVGLITTIINYENTLFIVLFMLERWIMPFLVILTLFEQFKVTIKAAERYIPQK